MVSKKITTYCDGDITKIENYEVALLDNRHTYVPYHRNLITPYGRMRKGTLININRFFGAKPEELVFLSREEVHSLERDIPLSKISMSTLNTVYYFWGQLNPNKLFKEITQDEFEWISISVPRLRILFHQMRARCENPNSNMWKWYGAKGIRVCEEWCEDSDKFVLWALKNGYRYRPGIRKGDQLSIDRIDPKGNYEPSNCRWIP